MATPPPLSSNPLGLRLVESMWIEFAIALVILVLRFYVRATIVRHIGWDDYLMLTAFLVTMAAFILNQLAANWGFGLHQADLEPPIVAQIIKWAFLGQVLGIMGSAFARMSFIATLVTLLAPQQRLQLWLLRIFFFFQVTINTMTALYILLQCRPTYGLWDHSVEAVCLPPYIQSDIGYSQGAVNSFSDLALAIFPATIIWKLNMNRSLKVSLCLTMGLGVFAFVTAIVKTYYLKTIGDAPEDATHMLWPIQFWFCIENSTLIIAATIPVLRPLVNRKRASQPTALVSTKQRSYAQFGGNLNKSRVPEGAVSLSSQSDRYELTGASKSGALYGAEVTNYSTAAADPESRVETRGHQAPPSNGIRKTVDTYVTY